MKNTTFNALAFVQLPNDSLCRCRCIASVLQVGASFASKSKETLGSIPSVPQVDLSFVKESVGSVTLSHRRDTF